MFVSALMAVVLAAPSVLPLDVTLVGPRHVLLVVPDDKSPEIDPEYWYILGPDDENYSTIQNPQAVSLREMPAGFEDDGRPARTVVAIVHFLFFVRT